MRIAALTQQNTAFTAQNDQTPQNKPKTADTNPISAGGERKVLIAGTFVTGLVASATLLLRLFFESEHSIQVLAKTSKELVDKKGAIKSVPKRYLAYAAGAVGLFGAVTAGLALIYTAFKAPNIVYNGKVNAFTKGKEMDVYIQGNKAETSLYEQIGEKAKTAGKGEKQELAKQYLQIKAAQNKVPNFVNQ